MSYYYIEFKINRRMVNQIFILTNKMWKSFMITDSEFWISYEKEKSVDLFEKATLDTGLMKHAKRYPLSSISEVIFNEADKAVKLKFKNEKGKDKNITLGFDDVETSNQFGETLGSTLSLNRKQEKGSALKAILPNLFFLILTIVGTAFVATLDDTSMITDTSRRGNGKSILVKLIFDTIGPTGIVIAGVIASIFLCYQIYKRYTAPFSKVVYTR